MASRAARVRCTAGKRRQRGSGGSAGLHAPSTHKARSKKHDERRRRAGTGRDAAKKAKSRLQKVSHDRLSRKAAGDNLPDRLTPMCVSTAADAHGLGGCAPVRRLGGGRHLQSGRQGLVARRALGQPPPAGRPNRILRRHHARRGRHAPDPQRRWPHLRQVRALFGCCRRPSLVAAKSAPSPTPPLFRPSRTARLTVAPPLCSQGTCTAWCRGGEPHGAAPCASHAQAAGGTTEAQRSRGRGGAILWPTLDGDARTGRGSVGTCGDIASWTRVAATRDDSRHALQCIGANTFFWVHAGRWACG